MGCNCGKKNLPVKQVVKPSQGKTPTTARQTTRRIIRRAVK